MLLKLLKSNKDHDFADNLTKILLKNKKSRVRGAWTRRKDR
jgi:hypothetical protein